MLRSSASLWYAWAAVIGIAAALVAVLVAHFWISVGLDPWLEARGLPRWLGHGLLSGIVIAVIGVAVHRVRAPH